MERKGRECFVGVNGMKEKVVGGEGGVGYGGVVGARERSLGERKKGISYPSIYPSIDLAKMTTDDEYVLSVIYLSIYQSICKEEYMQITNYLPTYLCAYVLIRNTIPCHAK